MCIEQRLGQHDGHLLARIAVVGLHSHVVNLRANTEGCVAGQGPGRGGPSDEVRCTPLCHFGLRVLHLELAYHRQVLHVSVAAGLVQLVRAQSRTCGGRIGLDGIAFIEQALLVELLQQPPEGLDVAVIVSDVRVFHVHPIAHLVRQVLPLLRELHHVLAAGGVVVGHGDGLADVFLRDAQRLLHAQLHGESVRIPSGLALHLEALHRLVAAEDVLDGTSHDVVNARHTVGRGRSFEEYEGRTSFTFCHTLGENLVFVPFLQHFLVDFR